MPSNQAPECGKCLLELEVLVMEGVSEICYYLDGLEYSYTEVCFCSVA